MPAGKSFKFHGSEIALMTRFASESPALAISAITNGNPPLITTSGNHGLSDGDVVEITGVVGMTELNQDTYIVDVQSATTFRLHGVDARDYGAYVSGGSISVGEFSNFCELTNYARQGGNKPEENTTSICSTAQEYELGLGDNGTTTIDYKFAPRTTIQEALKDFYESGDKMAVKITLPRAGGEMVQLGYVQSMSENGGVGQTIWRASMTLRNTGPRFDIAAA